MKSMFPIIRTISFSIMCLALSSFFFAGTDSFGEDIIIHVNTETTGAIMSTWLEPSMFAQYAPITALSEFIADSGGFTRGMFRITVGSEIGNSTSLQDLIQRLDSSAANLRCQAAANAGGQVLIIIARTPAWITSYPNLTEKVCNDWFKYWTFGPAFDKFDEWQSVAYEVVRHFNVDMGFTNITYEFWTEPDAMCYWNDSRDTFLNMWKHTVWGAEQADPNVRIGGIGPSTGMHAKFPGYTTPMILDWLQYSAANGLDVDVATYHRFSTPPIGHWWHVSTIAGWLDETGFGNVPIIASEFNPRDTYFSDPSWPVPPSPLGRQVDSEMGAAYVLTALKYMYSTGEPGYACFAALDNFTYSEEYPAGDWGARTHYVQNQIRKAIYHGLSISGRMARALVSSYIEENNTDEYFDHFHVFAGVNGPVMTILFWNYVNVPILETYYSLIDIGYDDDDWNGWGGTYVVRQYLENQIPVTDLTDDPQEQQDLEWSKRIYWRQKALVTETHSISFDVQNFFPDYGYHITRYLVDYTHSNSYYHYINSGLPDAIANQYLETVNELWIDNFEELDSIKVRPYAVSLLRVEADPVPRVANLMWDAGSKQTFHWDPATGATNYDIVRGLISDLRMDDNFSGAAEFSCNQSSLTATDTEIPPVGDGFYYLVRARNSQGAGSWGSLKRNSEITACP